MERRSHNEVEAIKTPTGLIPRYGDLKMLFRVVLTKEYPEEDYSKQFTVRIGANLSKIERVKKFYQTKVVDTPHVVFTVLEEQRQRLIEAQEKYGEYVSPFKLP
jgi:phosphoenolpyruvate carboxykinase (GTP)